MEHPSNNTIALYTEKKYTSKKDIHNLRETYKIIIADSKKRKTFANPELNDIYNINDDSYLDIWERRRLREKKK